LGRTYCEDEKSSVFLILLGLGEGGEEKRGWAVRPTVRVLLGRVVGEASSSGVARGNETDFEDEQEVEDEMRKPS
jgi:hypothetical protein